MSSGVRYMAYSPSPSTGPHSPHHLPIADNEKYALTLCPGLSPSSRYCGEFFVLVLRLGQISLLFVEYFGKIRSWSTGEQKLGLVDKLAIDVDICLLISGCCVRYIAELLAEKQKLGPFMQVLPCTSRLLNQAEILHVSALLGIPVLDQPGYQHGSPLINGGAMPNGRPVDMNGWASAVPSEGASMFHAPSRNWLNPQGHSGFIVKKTMRIDIPVDKYPNFNFVGRLLGPRGNSLKRVEANTDCRVLIRGRGSVKDSGREELMRAKPGYEHLNEPLHLVIEAELPAEVVDICLIQAREILEDMLKPVDESMDFFKKQQLRELAMLNGTLKDDSSQKSGSVSPFHNSMGMKRAKTRG
ncbi:hypothetical protein PR202_ga20677 [Eleusine coracana subsp. coracana]|uniref:K Homology domain-containing protein n=1 Tax=Eleusine coracana subsp. coracana TaxID=191504 RepID=A0AAV5CXA6_ELECO|nr:hypothetical protein PR202_ga20677 [Eleusine coracana subsp. coracana]